MMSRRSNPRPSSLLALAVFVAAGCGGSGGGGSASASALGSMRIRINWPQASRVIPSTTKVVKLKLQGISSDVSTVLLTKDATRPSDASKVSDIEFGDLKPGAYEVTAEAYPAENGTMTATGTDTVSVVAGQDREFHITMDSQLDAYKISGLTTEPFYLTADGAKNKNGNRITPTYDLTETNPYALTIVPVHGIGSGATELVLFDATASSTPFSLALGSAFKQNAIVLKNGKLTASLERVPNSTQEADSLTLTYTENGQQVSSYATNVAFQNTKEFRLTLNGLPDDLSSGLFKVDASLTQVDDAKDPIPGATFIGVQTGSTAPTFKFTTLTNRTSRYEADVTVRAKAVGGGFVTIGSSPDSGDDRLLPYVDQNAIEIMKASFYDLTAITNGLSLTTVARRTAPYSDHTLSVKVDGDTIAFPASMFKFEIDSTSATDAANAGFTIGTDGYSFLADSTKKYAKDASIKVKASFKLSNDSIALGTYTVKVSANAGTIDVGVN